MNSGLFCVALCHDLNTEQLICLNIHTKMLLVSDCVDSESILMLCCLEFVTE